MGLWEYGIMGLWDIYIYPERHVRDISTSVMLKILEIFSIGQLNDYYFYPLILLIQNKTKSIGDKLATNIFKIKR